jgi:hypothetical protein
MIPLFDHEKSSLPWLPAFVICDLQFDFRPSDSLDASIAPMISLTELNDPD